MVAWRIPEAGCWRQPSGSWIVVGNDAHRVGTVRDVGQNYIVTSTGLAGDIYVPASAIANVEHEVLHLSIPQRDVADGMGTAAARR